LRTSRHGCGYERFPTRPQACHNPQACYTCSIAHTAQRVQHSAQRGAYITIVYVSTCVHISTCMHDRREHRCSRAENRRRPFEMQPANSHGATLIRNSEASLRFSALKRLLRFRFRDPPRRSSESLTSSGVRPFLPKQTSPVGSCTRCSFATRLPIYPL